MQDQTRLTNLEAIPIDNLQSFTPADPTATPAEDDSSDVPLIVGCVVAALVATAVAVCMVVLCSRRKARQKQLRAQKNSLKERHQSHMDSTNGGASGHQFGMRRPAGQGEMNACMQGMQGMQSNPSMGGSMGGYTPSQGPPFIESMQGSSTHASSSREKNTPFSGVLLLLNHG